MNQKKEASWVPVSVVIPCFRCKDTIERAVKSIAAQTQLPQEIILIDDFSNDGGITLQALTQMQSGQTTVAIKIIGLKKNGGPGSARNAGWEIAKAPYVAFLDSDDSWHPQKLEIQYQWMVAHPEVAMSGHQTVKGGLESALPELQINPPAKRVSGRSLLFVNCFPTRSVMLKRDLAFRFVPGKRYAEDFLLWLTIVLRGNPAWMLQLPLAFSYKEEFGDGGLTGNLWKAERGVLDTYKHLHAEKLISFPMLVLVSGFSNLKFIRRLILVKYREFFD